MPAAELTRLRMQINQLILIFNQPVEFSRRLHDLLNLYANHAYRAGQAVHPRSLQASYRVPTLVMRQLELELGKTCQEVPRQALDLLDTLWEDSYVEPRLLAASLLGAIPLEGYAGEVIQKLRQWGRPEENLMIFTTLTERGTVNLRKQAPEMLLNLIDEWLESATPLQQAVGIRMLLPLIHDQTFQNLPAAFRMLSPLMQNPQPALHADLLAALREFIHRSPVETGYFLRQVLSLTEGNTTARLIRRVINEFSPDQQISLRSALSAKNTSG